MTVYLMEGFELETPFTDLGIVSDVGADPMKYDEGRSEVSKALYIALNRSGDHFRGLGFPVNLPGDFWFGSWVERGSESNASRAEHRFYVLYINGEPIVSIEGNTSPSGGRVGVIVNPSNSAPSTTVLSNGTYSENGILGPSQHLVTKITRGEEGGEVSVFVNGTLAVTAPNIPELALSEGAIDQIRLSFRSSYTSNTAAYGLHDDFWVGDQNYGDAKIPSFPVKEAGTYSEGLYFGNADRATALQSIPPQSTAYVEIEEDERETFTYYTDQIDYTDRKNIGGIQLSVRASGETNLRMMARVDGEDYEGEVAEPTPNTIKVLPLQMELNPATGEFWTKEELATIELGVKGEQ